MYNKILVPIDGSTPAALGLAEAIKLATNQGATLRLIHVVNEYIFTSSYDTGLAVASAIDSLRESGTSILKDGEASVRGAGVAVDSILTEALGGQAGHLIVQQAKDWRADLIVMGTHGRRGIRRLVMGSDAEFVIRHTPVPVLLVRGHEAIQA